MLREVISRKCFFIIGGKMTEFSKNIGKKIIFARQEKGFSQNLLAQKIGISQQCLSGYERGIRPIPLNVFTNICSCLDAPLSWFLPDVKQYGVIISDEDVEFLREIRRFVPQKILMDFIKAINKKQSNGDNDRCFAKDCHPK